MSASCKSSVLVNGKEQILEICKLSGQIQFTRSYCGGIAPKPDVSEHQNTPKPYNNRTLFVKHLSDSLYKEPIFHSFTTDQNGNFSLELPEGDYAILDEAKIKSYDIEKTFTDSKMQEYCHKWLNTPTITWKIVGSNKQINEKIHIPCTPCIPPAK